MDLIGKVMTEMDITIKLDKLYLSLINYFLYEENNLKNDNPMWKYEIEKYRKQKKKEKFFWIGSILGIISFVMNIFLNFEKLKALIFQWF